MRRVVAYHAYCKQEYVELAVGSAKSAKRHMPDIETVLLTEMDISEGFDRVVRVVPVPLEHAHLPPLLNLGGYDSVIYFDCDTEVCCPLYDVFELVEGGVVDIGLVQIRNRGPRDRYQLEGIPEAYPYWRSSFIAFRNGAETRRFFRIWKELFDRQQLRPRAVYLSDQPPMRAALYRSGLTVVTLPGEYHSSLSNVAVYGWIRSVFIPRGKRQRKWVQEANRRAPHARLFRDGKSTVL